MDWKGSINGLEGSIDGLEGQDRWIENGRWIERVVSMDWNGSIDGLEG